MKPGIRRGGGFGPRGAPSSVGERSLRKQIFIMLCGCDRAGRERSAVWWGGGCLAGWGSSHWVGQQGGGCLAGPGTERGHRGVRGDFLGAWSSLWGPRGPLSLQAGT